MKVLDRVLDVDSTLEGERVGMTIDQGALAHIMSVLTDLYSDPELAVIREYSTNALDAHLVAGVTRPIEVQLPTALSPFLRIRDFGLGLDADDIRDIYSRYGTSTKRDSDDVVGMLGLGCKSALTYTDQFTVTGIKNGRMTQISVGRDEDGAGSMTIVAEHDTNLDSGVEVTIPTRRENSLTAKATHFFSFWTEGTVLVNGVKPKRIDGMWLDDSLVLVPRQVGRMDKDYIVMGNVAYPYEAKNPNPNGSYSNRRRVVKFVPIGAVQFTPSREALQMTRLTKDVIAAVDAEVEAKLNAALTKSILEAKTPAEAIKKHREATTMGLSAPVQYQGRTVPTSLTRVPAGQTSYNAPTPYLGMAGYGRKMGGEWQHSVNLNDGRDLWLTNFTGADMTAVKREKLAQYLARECPGYTYDRWIAVEALTPDEAYWITGQKVIDFDLINAEKLPKSHKSSMTGRPRGSYKGYLDGEWEHAGIEAGTIDTEATLVYYLGNQTAFEVETHQQTRYDYNLYRPSVATPYPTDGTLVLLEANRVEKFKRDFPMALSLHEYAREQALAWYAKQDPADVEASRLLTNGEYSPLKNLDASKINDPVLAAKIRKIDRHTDAVRAGLNRYANHLGALPEIDTKCPLKDYPLVQGSTNHPHAYIYINAAFASQNGVSA